MQVVSMIGDWYVNERSTYISIYGATKAPHLLPRYAPDRLVIRKIAYQTILHGFNASLIKDHKNVPTLFYLHRVLWVARNLRFP